MQYYKEYSYINKEKLEFGTIIKKEDHYYVNEKEIINNRALVNDIVYIDNDEVVGIKERCNKKIVGILDLESKVRFSNGKNKSLFLFKPTNKSYSNFYVPYNNDSKNQNSNRNNNKKIYVVIEFKEWNITNKFPIGNCVEVIGKIDILENIYEHLRYFYDIKNNIMKIDNSKKNDDIKLLKSIQDITPDYEVFSIDPLGSKDIDDAFHFKKVDNEYYEMGIHIASPFKFFEYDLLNILDRVSTVYTPIRKYNMLPNNYADDMISLLENSNRYALSLILRVHNNNVINYELKETIVRSIKNYDYDTFDKIYDKNSILKDFFDFSNNFFNEKSIEYSVYDSHKLVENWMIYTNKFIAKYLIDLNLSNIILRTHNSHSTISTTSIKDVDEKLFNYLKVRNEESALYKIYDSSEMDQLQTHSKLDNEYYTHYTSPIRRAVDLFIHALILKKTDLLTKEQLENIIEKINIFTKNCRRFDRVAQRLKFIYTIKDAIDNIETDAYVIKIEKNRLTVYIPEYNLEEKITIIPYKFENITTVEFDEHSIKYNIDNEAEKKYDLYQKLQIKLWVFTSFENIFDKLKIEII
jgi:exoribonuclease R